MGSMQDEGTIFKAHLLNDNLVVTQLGDWPESKPQNWKMARSHLNRHITLTDDERDAFIRNLAISGYAEIVLPNYPKRI